VRVAVAGPIDLEILQPCLDTEVASAGYRFPMTAHLVAELVTRGIPTVAVTTDPAVHAPYRLRGPSLEVHVVPSRARARDRALDAFRAERRLLTEALVSAAPDVIHAHWTYEFAMAARATGLPTLVTVHDWAPAVLRLHRDVYRTIRLGMQARVLSTAPALTAVSPYIREKVERVYRKRVALVPNGVPAGLFATTPRPEPTDPVRFGALVAGDDARKNLRRLLEAFALVRATATRPVQLELAGGGCGPGEPLHRWAVERDLQRDVVFTGRLGSDRVPSFLGGLDAFVHPSLEESFGLVIVEAMAAGVPVVAGSRSGAPPWLLENGAAGLLVDVGDAGSLAQAMLRLLDAPERTTFSRAGRVRAEDFRMSRVADQYLEQYRALAR
jgi:glycosyltransferase involved in cell wall biosynthesis